MLGRSAFELEAVLDGAAMLSGPATDESVLRSLESICSGEVMLDNLMGDADRSGLVMSRPDQYCSQC